MNLIAANAISMFISSFARETEWDMSNYRTWLATKRPKFAVPWAIPVLPDEDQWSLDQLTGNKHNTMDSIIENINKNKMHYCLILMMPMFETMVDQKTHAVR